METHFIVSAIGEDRPGIVHRISSAILERGGNISIQRSVKLGGDFAILVMFTADVKTDGDRDRILEELNALQGDGLRVQAKVATQETQEDRPTRELNISGMDQVGIINSIAQHLLERGINIHAMDYTMVNGPFTAAPIFDAKVLFSVPPGLEPSTLQEELRSVEEEFNIDIEFSSPETKAG